MTAQRLPGRVAAAFVGGCSRLPVQPDHWFAGHCFDRLVCVGFLCVGLVAAHLVAVGGVAAADGPETLELSSDCWRAVFQPGRGGSLLALAVRRGGEWIDVVPDARRPENGMRPSSWLMLPYSNRIRDGRFSFGGRDHQLASAKNHAIHGDVRNRPWRVVEQGADRLVLALDSTDFADFNWPWPIRAEARIRVEGDSLVQSLVLENRGETPMPAGFGWHPYYRRWLTREGEPVLLGFAATAVHPDANHDGLPDGPPVPVPAELDFTVPRALDGRGIDTCFAGFDGRAVIEWPESGVRLRYECSPNVSHLVCYAPVDRPVVAVEPAANANDGVNRLAVGEPDHGVIVIPAGGRVEASFRTIVETR